MEEKEFKELVSFLKKVPAVGNAFSCGISEGKWWVKFYILTEHPLAWSAVQELGHVLNYLSLNERLPTAFYPVSPPPYMNGGPSDYLSWIIENTHASCTPDLVKTWLEGRLPRPVNDETAWVSE